MQDQSHHRGQPLVFRTLHEQLVALRQVTAADAFEMQILVSLPGIIEQLAFEQSTHKLAA